MGFLKVALSLFALYLDASVEAKSFLHVREEDMERALETQMAEVVTTENYEFVKAKLTTMFAALPKGADGGLEPAVVRYALHRYFEHHYGWHISGLGHGSQSNRSLTRVLTTRWTPARIQVLMEKLLKGHGLDLHNLAAFATTIKDLVHGEVADRLHQVFEALEISANDPLTEDQSDDISRGYLLSYLSDRKYSFFNRNEWESAEQDWADNWPHWESTLEFAADLSRAYDHFHQDMHNPFVKIEYNFADLAGFMEEFGQQFGSFQTGECVKIKERLMELELDGSGRAPLSQFYRAASNQFHFTETLEYLKHTHVLDQTDPTRPMVIIPNYMSSKSNCMKASVFYSICCPDECETLMAQVERHVQQPVAVPEQVNHAVSLLESDTVHAPRNLSSTLLARLNDIAQEHNGVVPLHGRLFAQWMHHAFPRECPFPQVGRSETMLPEDWMDATSQISVEISDIELEQWKNGVKGSPLAATEQDTPILPWIHTEDLIAGNRRDTEKQRGWFSAVRFVVAVTGLTAFAVKMFKMTKESSKVVGSCSDGKLDRYLI